MKKVTILLVSTIFVAICSSTVIAKTSKTCPANGKLKIFILSGQSNMVGFGQLAGSPGTMETYLKSNPKDYGHLVDDNGKHIVRDDVWIVNLSYKDKEQMGWLTTGYGASPDHIGPEYGFGFVAGDYFEDPVLLIKSAWGGRSLSKNFLSPSSADYPAPKTDGDTGFQYAEVLRHVKEITGNLKKYYPSYSGKGYEIVGFGWHQGWNDRINQQAVDAYEKNMENFIKDIRKDLGIEKLPFVIANTGMGGWTIPTTARYKVRVEKLMTAQLALADPEKYPDFKGNVSGVETRDFQRPTEESPSRQGYHWNRNWETFYLIGKGMGDSMVDLVSRKTWQSPYQITGSSSTTPYAVTDITFRAHDDVKMFGRLVLPKSNSPRAIVIYVQTAEGATVDQKRPLGGGKTFNYYDLYREKLTAMDIGFFSYEGRGIRMGDKPPRYEKIDWDIYNTSTLDNKVQDLLIAIETVKKQEGLQQIPILLMGASEGTLLVVEAAAKQPDAVEGLVLYGVMATNLRETLRYIMSDGEFLKYRSMDKNKDNIITKTEWDEVVKDVDFSKADLNSDDKFTVADIKILTKQYLDAIDNDDYKVLHAWAKAGAAVAIPDGWFKDHFSHEDMWSFLSKLDIPVGCFHGDADRMAPISAVKELETKVKKASLTKMEFHYFEGLDHSLNVGQYFVNGKMPKGHRAIFQFIDRIVPAK